MNDGARIGVAQRLIRAFFHSRDGLVAAFRSEQAVRIEVALLGFAMPLAWLVGADAPRRIALFASVLLILAVELLNTAVEKFCDHVTPERHPAIKMIKDAGSAAVLVTSLAVALFWLAALIERF